MSKSDCVKDVSEELTSSCGGTYNCIQTDYVQLATWRSYAENTEKFVTSFISILLENIKFMLRRYAMCGNYDGYQHVSKSVLTASCSNAYNKCLSQNTSQPTVVCMRDYVKDAFKNGSYKFCPYNMNLMVTPQVWAAMAYGLEYSIEGLNYCIAYCTP